MTQVIAKHEMHTNPHRQMAATGDFDDLGNVIVRAATIIRKVGDMFEWEESDAELQSMVNCGALVIATPEAIEDAKWEAERVRRLNE